MGRLRDNRKLAVWNERLLWGMFAVYSFVALEQLSLFALNLLDEIELWIRLFELLKPLKVYVNSLYFISYLVWNCLFFIWLYRCYSNIHLVKKEGLYSKGLIVWAWFIPFANLILPFRLLKSLYSSTLDLVGDASAVELKKMNRTINDMQVLWLFIWVFTVIVFLISFLGYTEQFMEILGMTSMVVQIASVLYILCKIRFVREYRKLEDLLNRRLTNSVDSLKSDSLIDSI